MDLVLLTNAFPLALQGKEKQVDECKQALADGSKSDHLLLADVFRMWEQAESRGNGPGFCYKNFLSRGTLGLLK